MDVIALHGFLGEGRDWSAVSAVLRGHGFNNFHPVDYTKEKSLSPERTSIENWGEAFRQWKGNYLGSRTPFALLGYSQGGRLGLQILKAMSPEISKAIFISTNPGFANGETGVRTQRYQNDQKWAERFRIEDWAQVLKDWNSLPVFNGGLATSEPSRTESAEAKRIAAESLLNWSLAKQEDFRSLIQENAKKILWVTGESDAKYIQTAEDLKKKIPGLRCAPIEGAGHRVLFDQPQKLADQIAKFLKS